MLLWEHVSGKMGNGQGECNQARSVILRWGGSTIRLCTEKGLCTTLLYRQSRTIYGRSTRKIVHIAKVRRNLAIMEAGIYLILNASWCYRQGKLLTADRDQVPLGHTTSYSGLNTCHSKLQNGPRDIPTRSIFDSIQCYAKRLPHLPWWHNCAFKYARRQNSTQDKCIHYK